MIHRQEVEKLIDGADILPNTIGGKGYSGARILDRVREGQTLEVDAISGATGSSKTILKALEIALRKGLRN